jgi:hypothetical protein
MNSHINDEVVRQEREKQRLGLSGGMQLKSYKDDSAKKVMAITRKGVAQFEAEDKLLDIKDSVDRFKVDRYFNDLSTSIANVINNYLQGVKQNDTGDIISKYNELCMYLKTVINWKTLSENDRNMIIAKFNELLPQVNELMDVAITEKYTDVKQIEELKNNLVVRNYVPVMYVNYAEAIKTKKPDYATRKMLSTKLFALLNEPLLDEAVKRDIEDKIEIYDEARNKYVSAKNKERKQFYKSILERQDKELNAYIDGIFKSLPKIPERGMYEPMQPLPKPLTEEEMKTRYEILTKEQRKLKREEALRLKAERTPYETENFDVPQSEFDKRSYRDKQRQIGQEIKRERQEELERIRKEKARLERIEQNKAERMGQIERPSRKPRNKEEELQQLEEFKTRKYFEGQEEENAQENIASLQKLAEDNMKGLQEELNFNLSKLEDKLKYKIEDLNRKESETLKQYEDDNVKLQKILDKYNEMSARMLKYQTDKPYLASKSKNPDVTANIKRLSTQYKDDQKNIVKFNIPEITSKKRANDEIITKIKNNYKQEREYFVQETRLNKQKLEKQAKSLASKEQKQLLKDLKQQAKLIPEVQMELSKNKADILQRLREREVERKRRSEENKPEIERERERRLALDKYYKEMRKEDRARNAEDVRERARVIKEEQKRMMEQEAEMFGQGKRRGRGIRNAFRKPLSIKNPSENDPNVELYPQYDLSKYDPQIIKRR